MWKKYHKPEDLITLTAGKVRRRSIGKLISFDTETKRYKTSNGEEVQKIYLFDFFDGTEHYTGHEMTEIYDFLRKLKRKYKKITIIAHNWTFDLQVSGLVVNVLTEEELVGLGRTEIYAGNNVLFVRFSSGTSGNKNFKSKSHNDKYFIQLLDTFNFFKAPLRELVASVGLDKFAKEEDYEMSPDQWNEFIEKYGKLLIYQDTEGLYKFFERFMEQPDIDMGITIADIAFRTFKKNFLKIDIELPFWVNEIALESYRGGRVEPYIISKDTYLYDYDVNSLYPYSMSRFKYSTQFIGEVENPKIEEILDDIRKERFNYLLNINFLLNAPRSPIILRDAKLKKLIQVTSGREVWLTGREVLALYEEEASILINRALKFENADLFSEYVEFWYAKKKTAQSQIERETAKLMLNSLYGKFAQHKSVTKFHKLEDFNDIDQLSIALNVKDGKNTFTLTEETNGITRGDPDKVYFAYGDIENENYFITTNEKNEPKYPVIIAAEITANARIHLWKLQKRMGYEHVYYSDTDSIFSDLTPEELPRDMIGTELGQLKVEREGLTTFYGNKDYEVIECCPLTKDMLLEVEKEHLEIIDPLYIVNKGVPKRARKIGKNQYEYEEFSKIKTRGRMDQVSVRKRKKHLKRKLDKLHYDEKLPYGIPLDLWKRYKDIEKILELIETQKVIETELIIRK